MVVGRGSFRSGWVWVGPRNRSLVPGALGLPLMVAIIGGEPRRFPQGALLIGNPDEVVEKIIRHSAALGGISRISFQMNAASLPHAKLMKAIEAIGTRVAPAVREA